MNDSQNRNFEGKSLGQLMAEGFEEFAAELRADKTKIAEKFRCRRVELPADFARLQTLLDRQDSGQSLTQSERDEAEALVNVAELLTLLRLRSERLSDD
ncbi:MAG: hypothetical protein WEB58_21430 [Planctomycetaceae bacterium]